ncbi:hypothetical protein COCSUDRAFT_43024 [Coccomyxa subellipsoidea C-169]|uniref:Uncharacterized protein n=1 Tax=Coccomyxa subellipsoidea (strain C-169) TaxID=574566 RepID=I0YUG9_COCSC|nr:hypothetical protein COCSUDRAFT_43024 [Coccomyxa subellipsoidea C-169]EIE22038.1 hypothetical protein COCSUDRAFT_43024 [Coccomyxa subellipsoidea C-169]|eukprot:XP_005646582.1 hypothetical protein COCSUDRAFT_43024 [Coccomyxa subellipsoidea C-169]
MAFVKATTVVLLAIAAVVAGRSLLATLSPVDIGRPCTLVGSNSASIVANSNGGACASCGSGTTATKPTDGCTFKPLTIKAGDSIPFYYHSSTHNLFLDSAPCRFEKEVCKSANSSVITASSPCTVTFPTAGTFYISDKAGTNGAYCSDFLTNVKITVT